MERDELRAWLRLTETSGLGPESARRLLAAFGSAEAVWAASAAAWRQVVVPKVVAAMAAPHEGIDALLERCLTWIGEQPARDIVSLADADYPPLLLQTADPPLLLYVQGRRGLLNESSIAVIGSRNPTAQGLDNARRLAAELCRAGHVVVSGLALGIDGAAHEGALDAGGSTVAVLGTGLDRVYPKRHLALAHRIAEKGLLVSEFALGMPALAPNFPRRNRIIAGLARGTLVVEAALQSGSLITARLALEAGRDVFAVPGSIHSPQTRGCHALIKQGAKLVEGAADILEELPLPPSAQTPAAAPSPPAAGVSQPLLDAMGYDPVSLDALVARTGWPAHEISVRMLDLELAGQVARLPGQLFQRRGAA